jgi:putative tryptophan/tyrosine transport system substrate-binding protein
VKLRAFISRVPGAAQHEATAQWCAADPGPLRTPSLERSRISGAPLHFVPRCTASGTRVIGRRAVISLLVGTAAALACPLRLRAQQPQGRLIGVLSPISAALAARNMEALRQGLRELGYVEGRNIAFEFRYADGELARLPALAAELVALQPAVIIAGSAPAALAAREATRAIPIVIASVQDPMALGLAASMPRPGGNVTGIWSEGDDSLIGKRLELFKDAVPGASRLAVFVDPADASDVSTVKAVPAAARALRLDLRVIEVRSASDFEAAFAAAAREGAQGLYVSQNPFFFARRAEIAAMALRARLPAVDGYREFAVAGGLMSYAASLPDFYRRFGAFVDKILKGANAGDLPIERATKFELVVNLKTAKALGLTIPESFLLRADEVIE